MNSEQRSPLRGAVARSRTAVVERASGSSVTPTRLMPVGDLSSQTADEFMPEPIRPKARRHVEIEIIGHRAGKLTELTDL